MSIDIAERFIVILAATYAAAACSSSSSLRSNVDAQDAWAGPADLTSDLVPKSDVSDAAPADLIAAGPDAPAFNPDGVTRDSAMPEKDAAPESASIPSDAATSDRVGSDGKISTDGGGSLACRAALGGLAPLVESDRPGAMALADVNGDGRLDVISGYDVRLGKGDGSFGPALSFGLTGQAGSLALGDLDNDGKLDIAVVGYSSHQASILFGHGDGTFAAGPEVTLGGEVGYMGSPVALADVDGDGKLDILTADFNADTVWVLLGRGGGNFAAEKHYPTGDAPDVVLAGDVNRDGKPDLIVLSHCAYWVDVLLNRGDGTFADKQEFPGVASSQCPMVRSAALGDVNQDGKPDLVVAGIYPGLVALLLGAGDGTFASPQGLASKEYLRSMSLFDLDGDGKLDVMLAQAGISILLGAGDGTFAPGKDYPAGNDLANALPGDLDGDGRMDVLMSFNGDSETGGETVWFGQGKGTFVGYPSYPVGGNQLSFAVGDINADEKLDIVTANQDASTVSVLLAKGDGTFAAARDFATGAYPQQVVLGDLDGDGKLDIVTASSSSVSVLPGVGDGSFAGKADYPTLEGLAVIALADLNGDGKLDVIRLAAKSSSTFNGSLEVLLGTGAGRLAAYVEYPVGLSPQSFAVGDLNADGKPDVVVANAGADGGWSIGLLLGKGDGTFAPMTVVSTDRASTVALGDLDRDGKLDIVSGNDWTDSVTVLLGKGDGTFDAAANTTMTWDDARSFVVTDWDGDGIPDLLSSGNSTSVLLGKGDGTFARRLTYPVSSGAMASADLNADGRPDFVTRAGTALVGVLLNLCQ